MIAWFAARRAWFAIVLPYLALGATLFVGFGVLTARADQAELRAEQSEIRAELASDRADHAVRESLQSCLDRQQAQQDVNEILLSIAALLNDTNRIRITTLIQARPPIEC